MRCATFSSNNKFHSWKIAIFGVSVFKIDDEPNKKWLSPIYIGLRFGVGVFNAWNWARQALLLFAQSSQFTTTLAMVLFRSLKRKWIYKKKTQYRSMQYGKNIFINKSINIFVFMVLIEFRLHFGSKWNNETFVLYFVYAGLI